MVQIFARKGVLMRAVVAYPLTPLPALANQNIRGSIDGRKGVSSANFSSKLAQKVFYISL
jgi:hypothetical protein